MDALSLLKEDHEKVAGLFEQLEPTTERAVKTREDLFTKLKQELDVHAHIEETIFYPVLKQEAETRDITLEALDEHKEIKDLLKQLSTTEPTGNAWDNLVGDLKRSVEHHVNEEEHEMVPNAQDVRSQQQLDELGTRMQEEKQRQQQQK